MQEMVDRLAKAKAAPRFPAVTEETAMQDSEMLAVLLLTTWWVKVSLSKDWENLVKVDGTMGLPSSTQCFGGWGSTSR